MAPERKSKRRIGHFEREGRFMGYMILLFAAIVLLSPFLPPFR